MPACDSGCFCRDAKEVSEIEIFSMIPSSNSVAMVEPLPDKKPRLVFFQFKYDDTLPAFLLAHSREHARCLSQFFDVILINQDCDYGEVCDTYEPALALFESGVNHASCRRLRITNVRCDRNVPKLGLHHADAFCNARAGFLSDMDHWGIETFFAISTTAAEHNPGIATQLFSWPVFVDGTIFRDYGIWKSIPVLLTGNNNALYPWRNQLWPKLRERYGTLTWPHPGYTKGTPPARILMGEEYARTINAAWFVPACGTAAKEVVRKHFEVPASRACLVTEQSPGLEAAGFSDMKNCVFADSRNVFEKLDFLFRNQDVLMGIIDSGYTLVRERHTIRSRDQIYEWYLLRKNLKPGQTIVQEGPFGEMRVVEKGPNIHSIHIKSQGVHLKLLAEGDAYLSRGEYEEAQRCYVKCASYMPWMPEPKLRRALCKLYKGEARSALFLIEELLTFILAVYGAEDPDPVEWAYYLIALLCAGNPKRALICADAYPMLRHPHLDRARRAVMFLTRTGSDAPFPATSGGRDRVTLHRLPDGGSDAWIQGVCAMLRACKQTEMANLITQRWISQNVRGDSWELRPAPHVQQSLAGKPVGGKHVSKNWFAPFHRRVAKAQFRRLFFQSELRRTSHKIAKVALHRIEERFGCFLPYRISSIKGDEFFRLLRDVARDDESAAILIIGATLTGCSIQAIIAGANESVRHPSISCVGTSMETSVRRAIQNYAAGSWYRIPETSFSSAVDTISIIKAERKIRRFDLLFITDHLGDIAWTSTQLREELLGAKTVVLEDLHNESIFAIYESLLSASNLHLTAQNPGLRKGYAVFTRSETAVNSPSAQDSSSALSC
jgi:tetratricopeptide (TPR) repeat protein